MKHTELPWEIDKEGFSIFGPKHVLNRYIGTCSGNAKEDAQFIVTACNSHEELVEMLSIITSELMASLVLVRAYANQQEQEPEFYEEMSKLQIKIDKAQLLLKEVNHE